MNKNFWEEKITIGNKQYPRFMAAPLDGITDSPLRQLIRHFSPDELLFGEMRHVALVSNEKTGHSLKYKQVEQPLCFQVSANKPDFVEKAINRVIDNGFCMLNLNVGCPARKVVGSGSGSALMADLPRLEKLLKQMQALCDGKISFTIKIRAGFKEKNGLEVARLAQDCGAQMLAIHPRTAPGKFSAPLDYEMVAQIKQALDIPIIFSGNINSFARAKKVYERTGCDGFMIGRALWGAPWKIHEIREQAAGRSFSISVSEMIRYALLHLDLEMVHYGDRGFYHFKKQLPQYIKGVEHAGEMRKTLLQSQTLEEMQSLLQALHVQQVELEQSEQINPLLSSVGNAPTQIQL